MPMAKKAFYVTFEITERVIVDVEDEKLKNPQEYQKVITEASDKIKGNIDIYLNKYTPSKAIFLHDFLSYDPVLDESIQKA
jgi:hypothetical protein